MHTKCFELCRSLNCFQSLYFLSHFGSISKIYASFCFFTVTSSFTVTTIKIRANFLCNSLLHRNKTPYIWTNSFCQFFWKLVQSEEDYFSKIRKFNNPRDVIKLKLGQKGPNLHTTLYTNFEKKIKFNNYSFWDQFLKLWYGPLLIRRSNGILKLGQKRPKFVSTIGEIRSNVIGYETLRWGKCLWG